MVKLIREGATEVVEEQILSFSSVWIWGQALWLMPVRPRWVGHLRLGVRDQHGQHVETPSVLKIEKVAGHGGTHL